MLPVLLTDPDQTRGKSGCVPEKRSKCTMIRMSAVSQLRAERGQNVSAETWNAQDRNHPGFPVRRIGSGKKARAR